VAEVVADFVDHAKQRRPDLLYVCDPVCGDDDLGPFVDPALQRLFSQRLLPRADVATPNAWELRALTNDGDLITAARKLQESGPSRVVVTGGNAEAPELHTTVFDRAHVARIRTPRLPARPAGTGDLFTAVLTARLLQGDEIGPAAAHAVAATFGVLERTPHEHWSEMPIDAALATILAPPHRFCLEPLHG